MSIPAEKRLIFQVFRLEETPLASLGSDSGRGLPLIPGKLFSPEQLGLEGI